MAGYAARRQCPLRVESGNAHNEPMMSAFHPKATEQRTRFYVASCQKQTSTQRAEWTCNVRRCGGTNVSQRGSAEQEGELHHVNRPRSAFASFKSEVPNPSVNQL